MNIKETHQQREVILTGTELQGLYTLVITSVRYNSVWHYNRSMTKPFWSPICKA